MANDYIPRPGARFHAWQSSFPTYVNGHVADSGLAARAMRTEIQVKVGDPAPTPPSPGWPGRETQSREEERTTVARCPHLLWLSNGCSR